MTHIHRAIRISRWRCTVRFCGMRPQRSLAAAVLLAIGFGLALPAPATAQVTSETERLIHACEQGDPHACYCMSYRESDPSKAAVWLDQGCEGGSYEACNYLGYLYEEGIGVSQLPLAAELRYKRANVIADQQCVRGDATACHDVGDALLMGRGAPLDVLKAGEYYLLACRGDMARACYSLARVLEREPGAEAARTAANMYQLGCDLGWGPACLWVELRRGDAQSAAPARGWLGAGVQNLTGEVADDLGRQPALGALVVEVVDGSPAAKARLRPGDLVVAVDGRGIREARELVEAMGRLAPGAETRLKLIREGVEQVVVVTIEQRPPSP